MLVDLVFLLVVFCWIKSNVYKFFNGRTHKHDKMPLEQEFNNLKNKLGSIEDEIKRQVAERLSRYDLTLVGARANAISGLILMEIFQNLLAC